MGSISEQTIRTKSKPIIQEMDSRYGRGEATVSIQLQAFSCIPRWTIPACLNPRLRTTFPVVQCFYAVLLGFLVCCSGNQEIELDGSLV